MSPGGQPEALADQEQLTSLAIIIRVDSNWGGHCSMVRVGARAAQWQWSSKGPGFKAGNFFHINWAVFL